ncbi:MAG: Rieske 2Fe-2S domain-containing protein [bacterium]|jgi:nitrite reductase/ring-hydroxylating ferredoxin subunit|nr:Rieske 2Fe-2S domain-containing protein [bacterium]
MARHVVARVDEIPVGARKIVELEGRSIGVFHVKDSFYALRNRCPHQGGPLCEGQVSGFATAEVPGAYVYTRQGEILRCPWHGWEFDVKTGQSWFDPQKVRVKSYEVHVEKAAEIEKDGDLAGFAKGPFQAETYSVTIEEAYVVVEV